MAGYGEQDQDKEHDDERFHSSVNPLPKWRDDWTYSFT
jgi:hypothetical protein